MLINLLSYLWDTMLHTALGDAHRDLTTDDKSVFGQAK
jgi:hypothetical protein